MTPTRFLSVALAVTAGSVALSADADAQRGGGRGRPARPATREAARAHALELLATFPLVDGHNDLPWAIREQVGMLRDVDAYDLRKKSPHQTDLARMRAGRLGGQFWSVYIPGDIKDSGFARVQLEQIDIARRVIAKYPEAFVAANTAAEMRAAFRNRKVGSMLGMEGGHAIENSLGALRAYYDLGVRYMTLTHNVTIDWADAANDAPRNGGLTNFGREVVREMNRMGMLVDLSHVSPAVMSQALDVSEAPVMFSHSSARALVDHPRNVPDSILRRLPRNGGVVMVNFYPPFNSPPVRAHGLERTRQQAALRQRLGADTAGITRALRMWDSANPLPKSSLAEIANMIDHIRRTAGPDHVGIGSDYDGVDDDLPVGLEDLSNYPDLLAELIMRGWSDTDLKKLAGENILRALEAAERVSARLKRERGPSTKTIEELDGRVPAQAQSRAFLIKLGADTFAVERVARTGNIVEGTLVRRFPATSLLKYSLTLNPDGTVASYEQGTWRADGTAMPPNAQTGVAQVGLRMTFAGDSVVRIVPTNGLPVERRSAAPRGTLPAIGTSWYAYELQVAAARRNGRASVIGFAANQNAAVYPDIRLVSADSAEIVTQGFRTGLRFGGDGQLAHGDASLTTQKFDVRPIRDADVAALASAWTARESGGAPAVLSTRDTARASFGGASVALDYGRPAMRGRQIWGSLVPLDTVWRFGANGAAQLTTDRDLDIGGSTIPAGTYTVWLLPLRNGAHLIVNRKTKDDRGVALWGTMYDASQDLAHIPLEPRTFRDSAERFTASFTATELVLQWDRAGYAVKVRAK